MSAELTEQLILVVHLLLALAIIGLIMLQQGKGADMGASFGAGASQTLFGSSGGGNVLTRATAWMVALFFATSFGLAVIAKNRTDSAGSFDMQLPADEVIPVVEGDLPAATESVELPVSDEDLPVVDEALPELSAGQDEDLPELE